VPVVVGQACLVRVGLVRGRKSDNKKKGDESATKKEEGKGAPPDKKRGPFCKKGPLGWPKKKKTNGLRTLLRNTNSVRKKGREGFALCVAISRLKA